MNKKPERAVPPGRDDAPSEPAERAPFAYDVKTDGGADRAAPVAYDVDANLDADRAAPMSYDNSGEAGKNKDEKTVIAAFRAIISEAKKHVHHDIKVDENGHLVPPSEFRPTPDKLKILNDYNRKMVELVRKHYVPESIVNYFGPDSLGD